MRFWGKGAYAEKQGKIKNMFIELYSSKERGIG